ncbi:PAP2-domain-containing protein [Auriscalpium vulgare]|uniref:PAP2-domain-containing protein n=1 Tax=Auriscalpium vulgare TaxID=40419 RepID=A0ACB8RRN8_9AGAM|nr:PAP2-domain-containing protein [Auriscalpium vulgare]
MAQNHNRRSDAGSLFYPPNTYPYVERPAVAGRDDKSSVGRSGLSYLPDWILTVLLTAAFLTLDKVSGFHRQFSLSDPTLSYPFAEHERVPDWAVYFIAIILPPVFLWIINVVTIRSWQEAHISTLGVLLGLSITGSITQFVRITVGRPRPDIISRCRPDADAIDPPFGLSTFSEVCHPTLSKAFIEDGFRSFPSGHASLSFAGLGFLTFYIAGKTRLFHHRGHAWKAWLALTPLSVAVLVAISRTEDNLHHWEDVSVGGLLGLTVAYFAYRQYYPSLSSEFSPYPYVLRIQVEPTLPVHHQFRNASPNRHSGDGGSDVELLLGRAKRNEPSPLREVLKPGANA